VSGASVVEQVARAFCRDLRACIASLCERGYAADPRFKTTAAIMKEIDRRNAADGYSAMTCASHDFCDANEPMISAFEEIIGCEPDAGSDKDAAVMNAAWGRAKRAAFALDLEVSP
jgi:hypothetical protein